MPFTMYHASPMGNAVSIMKRGLIPRPSPHRTMWTPKEEATYLANSVIIAKDFADQAFKLRESDARAWGIFKIYYDDVFPDEIYPDLDWGVPGVYYVKKWIPPENISFEMVYYVGPNIKRVKKTKRSNPSILKDPYGHYDHVKRTPRGSLVSIKRKGHKARIEVTNHEDMQDISRLLSASGIEWQILRFEEVYKHWTGIPSLKPKLIVEFNYDELEKVIMGLSLSPVMLTSGGEII